MKRCFLFPILATALLGAGAPPEAQPRAGIAACIALEPRMTDAGGAVWIYRETPFGVARFRQEPGTAPVAAAGIRATEDGDAIRFERPGPFGTYRWQREKSELN